MAVAAPGASAPSCPLCKHAHTVLITRVADVEYFTSDRLYAYWNCRGCDSIFIDPPPVERLAEIYPDNYYSNRGPQASLGEAVKTWLDRRLFTSVLSQIPGASLRVLDIGGGTGWMLTLARQADRRVTRTVVIDLNTASRSLAEQRGHEFFCMRVEDFRGTDKFDLIIMLNLIEHVADPEAVLARVAEMLTNSGRVILKTPNTRTWDRYLFQGAYWGGYHCPRHWVLFNRESLSKAARNAGLEPVIISYTQGAPQWTASVLGTLAQKQWIRLSRQRPMFAHPLGAVLQVCFAAFDFVRAPLFPTAQMFAVLKLGRRPQAEAEEIPQVL